jgi:hypothetical protein
MAFCGGCIPARRGEMFLRSMATGIRSIGGSDDGASQVFWESVALAEKMAESRHYNIESTTVRAHVSAPGGKGGSAVVPVV